MPMGNKKASKTGARKKRAATKASSSPHTHARKSSAARSLLKKAPRSIRAGARARAPTSRASLEAGAPRGGPLKAGAKTGSLATALPWKASRKSTTLSVSPRETVSRPQRADRVKNAGPSVAVPAKAASPQRLIIRRLPSAELTRIRDLLTKKKTAISNHLQTELTELEKPEKRHRADLEEIASDTHDTDSLCEIMDIEATQIDQIDLALSKIENGTYGICEDCGQEIPLPRLEALPFATQCIVCKRKAEFAGQIAASDSAPSL